MASGLSSQPGIVGMKRASSLPSELKDRLESVLDNIRILHKQINDGATLRLLPECTGAASRGSADVFSKLNCCAQVVSDGCTKLAVLFSKPPLPTLQECGVMCERVEQSILQLVSTLYQLSPSQGKTLLKEVENVVLRILNSLENQVLAIMKHGCTGNAAPQLRGTGTVWESCEAMGKLSKDNRSAALKILLSQLHLLRDAWTEMEELKANNGRSEDCFDDEMEVMTELSDSLQRSQLADSPAVDCDDRMSANGGGQEWSEDEMKFVNPALKLIETSSEIAKESSTLLVMFGDANDERCIEEMDTAVQVMKQLSPSVDDLASELSAPLDTEQCRKLGLELGDTLLRIVDTLSNFHFCTKAGSKWEATKYQQTIRTALDSFSSKLN